MLAIIEFTLPFWHSSIDTTICDSGSVCVGGYSKFIPRFGFIPTKGTHSSRKITSSGEVIYDVIYTIGDDGYRKDNTSEFYNVYIYGGSYTFGEGLNDNETISYYLAKNYNINSKNYGIHGYGLHQALFTLGSKVEITDNGINILLTFPLHSLRSSCKVGYSAKSPRYIIQDESLKLHGVCPGGGIFSRIISKSKIVELIKQIFIYKNIKITDEDINLYFKIIEEIAKLTKQKNSKLIIAYIDATDEQLTDTSWTNKLIFERMESITNTVIDTTLADSFEELPNHLYIHELDKHPSAKANKERARLISNAIRKINLN